VTVSFVRNIKKVLKGKPMIEGAGVHLKRIFGYQHVPQFDPFLLFDDFHANNPDDYINGFPLHPHRGIETITYMLKGRIEHGDSLGNKGIIYAGDIQWMTAGNGIIHQEMPKGQEDGLLWGFQLWANLPASHKMMEPRYREITSDQIPEVELDNGVRIKIISGTANGIKGVVQDIIIDPEYLDITVPAETDFVHLVKKEHTVFAYIIEGKGYFEPERDPYHFEIEGRNYFDFKSDCLIETESLVLFGEGREISVSTLDEDVRFLLISGKPIKEPVAWYGPIVMNTREELRIAFDEYYKGTFFKHSKK
jgi:redox-sensitive bicupin YhaK (pirin superfamily)